MYDHCYYRQNHFVGKAVGEQLFSSGDTFTSGRIPEEICDTLHALHGVSHPRANSAPWQYLAVFWAGYEIYIYSLDMSHPIHSCYLLTPTPGVEKNNDDAKHHFYSSNRHDPCGEVLRTEKRLECLDRSCRREKRRYCKRDEQYWSDGISEARAAKQCRSC